MPEEAKPARDVRVDSIGFVDELESQFADGLRKAVKLTMLDKKIERVQADYFQGLIISGGLTSAIEPEEFLKLYEAKKITRDQFLAAITVKNEPAKKCLSGEQIYAISTRSRTAPSLRIRRIEGVEIKLVDAVQRLNAEIK